MANGDILMPNANVKPCWRDYGLAERGASICEAALAEMMTLVKSIGSEEIAKIVLREAAFRLSLFPKRTLTKGFILVRVEFGHSLYPLQLFSPSMSISTLDTA